MSAISDRCRLALFNSLPFIGIAIGIMALMVSLFLMQLALLHQIDLKIYDRYLAGMADGVVTTPATLIDIDEASLARYGQWPWPRHRLARLITTLTEAGAASVALDILLAEPDRTSPAHLLSTWKKELGLEVSLNGIPAALLDNDAFLAQSVSGAPVIFGGYFHFDGEPEAEVSALKTPESKGSETLPPGVSVVERSKPDALPAASQLTQGKWISWPTPVLANAAAVAFFNMSLDQDGLVRQVPLLLRLEDTIYANLSLRAIMTALKVSSLRLTSGPDGLERIGVGPMSIPVTPDGSMRVLYRGPSFTFPSLSAAKILDATFDPELIRNRILFIGTSAAGLQDIRSTPLDRYTPGVEVHANVVDAIFSGRFISVPPWNSGLQVLIILATSLFCLACSALRPALAAGCMILFLAGLYCGSERLFQQGHFITPLWGMLTLVAEGAGLTLFRQWRAEHDKHRIRKVFGRYVSPEIVTRIVERGAEILKGEERELTIMFTDLRGFTSLSENLTPQQVVSLLNTYFTPMTALVRESRGTLDKFIGDALMAFWNAPVDTPNHPHQAVATALAMQKALTQLNPQLREEYQLELRMGAGIHTGTAHVGNMGSSDLTSYTAIGDAVNLASRLEGLCSRYGFSTVISGETAARCGEEYIFQHLAVLRVKGRNEPVDVYTVMLPEEAENRAHELQLYAQARSLYDAALPSHDLDALREAATLFQALRDSFPQRGLYQEYTEFCTDLLAHAPDNPPDNPSDNPEKLWTPIWTLTSK